MVNWVENFLINQFRGKVVAQAAIVISAYIAGPIVQGFAVKAGITISADPVKLQAELMALSLIAFEWFKARRRANPNSVAIQTDPAKGAVPVIP